MDSTEVLQAHFKNDRERFLNMLDSIIILDIGTIDSISAEGRASVTSSTFIGNAPIKYADAEVIYPGNANGCHAAACPGMTCLIFLPKSCMPKVSDRKLRIGATSYNRDGVKVMPIGNGTNNNVKTFFSANGDYSISGRSFNIMITSTDVTLQRSDNTTSISMDGTGQLYVKSGQYSAKVEETGVIQEWASQDNSVIWADTLNTDGSRTLVQKDSGDNVLSSVTISATGEISISNAKDISIESAENINVDADQINMNGDAKSLVTYAALNTALSNFASSLSQALLTATYVPVSGTPTVLAWPGGNPPSSIDISDAEASTLKTGSSS